MVARKCVSWILEMDHCCQQKGPRTKPFGGKFSPPLLFAVMGMVCSKLRLGTRMVKFGFGVTFLYRVQPPFCQGNDTNPPLTHICVRPQTLLFCCSVSFLQCFVFNFLPWTIKSQKNDEVCFRDDIWLGMVSLTLSLVFRLLNTNLFCFTSG